MLSRIIYILCSQYMSQLISFNEGIVTGGYKLYLSHVNAHFNGIMLYWSVVCVKIGT